MDLDATKKELEELRAELREQLVERGANPDDDSMDESGNEGGFADAAQTTAERDKILAVVERLRDQLAAVEQALGRVAEGTYGTCASCGAEIPSERLEALPYVVLCVDCKTKKDRPLS
ncbi:MAG: TraR/DksA family transcriptional regulator [Actinomycetota bacterium]